MYGVSLPSITPPQIPLFVHHATRPKATTGLPPVPESPGWAARVATIESELAANQGATDLVFCGDSITEFFKLTHGAAVWTSYYGTRRVLNQGIGGDVTQGLLHRLMIARHIAGITPKLVVVLIGTNNTFPFTSPALWPIATPYEIRDGIMACVQTIRLASPTTRVLLLSMLPRDVAGSSIRTRINLANALLRVHPYIDGQNVTLLDLGNFFKNPSTQNLITGLYIGDNIHPNAAGYGVIAAQIEPYVVSALAGQSFSTPVVVSPFVELSKYIECRYSEPASAIANPKLVKSRPITAISKAAGAVVTAANDFPNGMLVSFSGVQGMEEINGLVSVVSGASATGFTAADIDSTAFTSFTSGGVATLVQDVAVGKDVRVLYDASLPKGRLYDAVRRIAERLAELGGGGES